MIVAVNQVRAGECAVLSFVMSPLGRALNRDEDILSLLTKDPTKGAERLAALEDQTREEMTSSLDGGADGVFYFLDGASPSHSTPMEYGGHFLEIDRRLLQEFAHATFNLLYVSGKSEPYIDFVSDLPAHGFAWDQASGITAQEVRSMRQGALMGIEFQLEATPEQLARLMTGKVVC